jgi:hypothetical protein
LHSLSQHNIGAIVVLDEAAALIGILSERDVVRQLRQRDDLLSQPVKELMTAKVITCVPQDDLMSAAQRDDRAPFSAYAGGGAGQAVGHHFYWRRVEGAARLLSWPDRHAGNTDFSH